MTDLADYTRRLDSTSLIGDVTFAAALEQFSTTIGESAAVGFAYTPRSAPWFRREGETWLQRGGAPIPHDAFEIRAFSSSHELRWWRTTGFDRGPAVTLTEVAVTADPTPDGIYRLSERALLLWGTTTGRCDDGWVNVAEGRVGDELWLPIGDTPKARTQLTMIVADYVSLDRHGNVGVVEQRIVGIGTVSGNSAPIEVETK